MFAASPAEAQVGPAVGARVAASHQAPEAGVGADGRVWAGERRGTTTPQPGTVVGSCVAPQTGAGDECESGLLYRGDLATQEALTPRPGNDTVGWPNNGLSTCSVKARACARSTKVQILSPTLL